MWWGVLFVSWLAFFSTVTTQSPERRGHRLRRRAHSRSARAQAEARRSTHLDLDDRSLNSSLEKRSTTKYVFMHVIVGNTYHHTQADWSTDIQAMQAQGIDAIALNIGGDDWQRTQVSYAYAAAEALGSSVKLFFSFDFTTNLGCTLSDIVARTLEYSSHPYQFMYDGKPFVSSYEGGCLGANGWQSLKDSTDAYLMPFISGFEGNFGSWSVLDSWYCWGCAWPQVDSNKTTADDQYYISQLGAKYATTISGWFFAHLSPGDKNRLLRADDWLLNSRWNQLVQMRDELTFVEMVTWNDFGESDYFGPLTSDQPTGTTWANGYPHTVWMEMSGYYINAFKTGTYPAITKDIIYYWARPHPYNAVATADSLARPANYDWTADQLWAAAFCSSACTVTLKCGSSSNTWPNLAAGVNLLKLSLAAGGITVQMVKGSTTVINQSPTDYTFVAKPTLYNYNAYVGAASATTSTSTSTSTITNKSTSIATTTTLTTTATAATSTATTVNSVSWTYLGCHSDNDSSRTLSGAEYDDNTANSASTCLAKCGKAGYAYAGVECSSQCFCANSIKNGMTPQSESGCNYPCSSGTGNCGGLNYINIYNAPVFPAMTTTRTTSTTRTSTSTATTTASTATTTSAAGVSWTFEGCHADNPSARVLSYTVAESSINTVSSCLSTCAGLGYTWGGVEFGVQCFCGGSLASSAVLSSSSNCNYACSGGGGTCGGFDYIGMYNAAGGLVTTMTTIPAATTTNTATTSTVWSYLGCYPDSPGSRILSGKEIDSGTANSVASCQSACSTAGYAYAGVEYGLQCFCGSSLKSGISAASETNCNYQCSSAVGTCGGFGFMNVYEAPASTSTSTSASSSTTIIGSVSWIFLGCYTDDPSAHVLSYAAAESSANSVISCLTTCAGRGYIFGGVEFGDQCFCGSSLASSAKLSSGTNCDYVCSSGVGTCGGFNYIDVYNADIGV